MYCQENISEYLFDLKLNIPGVNVSQLQVSIHYQYDR